MKTAAIYCRVSTDEQLKEGSGLETQKRRCLELVEKLGYHASDEYIFMESWTGSTIDRPFLSQLRILALQHKIDAVFVFSPDRLTRNSTDALLLRDEFKKNSTELRFVTDDFAANCENESLVKLLTFIFGWKDEEERKAISRRSMEGRRYWAQNGRITTGRLRIYGYDVVVNTYSDDKTGRLKKEIKRLVNENEASLIRQIFQWAAEGVSLHKIAEMLTASGLPSPRGKNIWRVSTIHAILTNEIYTGKTYAFKYKAVEPQRPKPTDPFTGFKPRRRYPRTSRKLLPRESWIEVPGKITPQIVPTEIFDQVVSMMATHRECPKPLWQRYLLSGRLKCGTCGKKYWGAQGKTFKNGTKQLAYRCMGKSKVNLPQGEETCKSSMISCRKLEDIVWTQVKKVLSEPDVVKAEMERLWASSQEEMLSKSELGLLEREIVALKEEQQRLLRAYMKKQIDEDIFEKETKLIKMRNLNLHNRKQDIVRRIESKKLAEEQLTKLKKFYSELANTLDSLNQQEKRLAIEALDIKVTIRPEKIHIQGTLPLVEAETNLRALSTQLTTFAPPAPHWMPVPQPSENRALAPSGVSP